MNGFEVDSDPRQRWAYARGLQYQDARIDIETTAGKMLRAVA
jgi:hypothetical protein